MPGPGPNLCGEPPPFYHLAFDDTIEEQANATTPPPTPDPTSCLPGATRSNGFAYGEWWYTTR